MCPEKERYSREVLNIYHRYETHLSESTFPFSGEQTPQLGSIDGRLMIKEYSRSSADQDTPLSIEMRSSTVLTDTMRYLINIIIPRVDIDTQIIGDWFDFVWNRTRSIRKEIIQLRLLFDNTNDNTKVSNGLFIIEQCARFHIMCAHHLCDQNEQVFSSKINEENLTNCFDPLKQYYEMTWSAKVDQTRRSPNEAEFCSYMILLNLSESNILLKIQRWPQQQRHSAPVKFALKLYFAFNSNNYVRFFRLMKSKECTYLQACILHRYIFKMRKLAFKTIFNAYKDNKEKAFPFSKLRQLLCFDNDQDLIDYCNYFILDINSDANTVTMPSNLSLACFDLEKSEEDILVKKRSYLLVDYKFELEASEMDNNNYLSILIYGKNNPDIPVTYLYGYHPGNPNEHILTSSFSQQGYYISDDIRQLLQTATELKRNVSLNKTKSIGKTNQQLTKSKTSTLRNRNDSDSSNTSDGPFSKATKKDSSLIKTAKHLVKNSIVRKAQHPSFSGLKEKSNEGKCTFSFPLFFFQFLNS
jgi:hypothetical protein